MTDVTNQIDVAGQVWFPAGSPTLVQAQSRAMAFVADTCTEAQLRAIDATLGFVDDGRVFGDSAAAIAAFRQMPLDDPSAAIQSRIVGVVMAAKIIEAGAPSSEITPASFLLGRNTMLDGRPPVRVFDRGQLTPDSFFRFRTALRAAIEGIGIQPRVVRAPR